jgi:S1-C subfamily serine protease
MQTAAATSTVEMQGVEDATWKSYRVAVLLGKNKCVDVAVLVPAEKKVLVATPISYPSEVTFGREVYFLGFPYGLFTSFGTQAQSIALVKHAYASGVTNRAAFFPDGDKDEPLLLLDGLNNPGFSGGPVVGLDHKVIGVISGFRNYAIPLKVDGKMMTNATTPTNSGTIIVTYVNQAVDLIKAYAEKQKKP